MEKTNFNEIDNGVKMDNLDTPFYNNEPLVDMSKAMSIIKINKKILFAFLIVIL